MQSVLVFLGIFRHDTAESMLEQLFGSRTRVKLLSLFLRQQQEPLFVREITREIGTQINAVRRELANLVKFGLITEVIVEEEGESKKKRPGLKRKYYKINKDFPLLREISSLVLKAQLLLEHALDKEIIALGDVRFLAFLGIFLGGASAPVDLFIVGDIDRDKLNALMADTERDLNCEIKYSVMPLEEFRYRKDMTDKFLYAILEANKNIVVDKLHLKETLG